MKSKLIGILIGLMLMATFFTVAKNDKNVPLSTEQNTQTTGMSIENITVPSWEVGDYWNYRINTIVIDLNMSDFIIHLAFWTDQISLHVIDDSGDFYTADINATIDGNGYINMDFGDGLINITGQLQDTILTGTILFNKSDLGITHLDALLDGEIKLNIIENPYIPIDIPLKIPATINASVDSSVPYPIIEFPLNVSHIWGLPAANMSIDGTIESPWFKFMDRLNNFAQKHWNLVEIIVNLLYKLQILPYVDPALLRNISDILADIFPIIDISDVLTKYVGIEPVFPFPEVPEIFHCNNTENITIEDKTFFVYNISIGGGIGSMYYAPEAGMIAKILGRFKDVIPFITDLDAELIDYHYS